MFSAVSMNYQCEPCSAADLRSMLGPASAPMSMLGESPECTNSGLCSHSYADVFTNPYMFPFDTNTAFPPSPTASSQRGTFSDASRKSSSSNTPPLGDYEWDHALHAAWNDSSVTPKLIQRQLKRREQNRASQRAFRERKEKHAKYLEEKIDQLEVKLQSMDTANADLERQLAELRARRDIEDDDICRSISRSSDLAQTPMLIDASDPSTQDGCKGEDEEQLCRQCRRSSRRDWGQRPVSKSSGRTHTQQLNSQMFLP